MTAVLIGNGPSREGFDLNIFTGKAVTYGCNAVYRDYPDVDYVVYIDGGIATELQRQKFPPAKILAPTMKETFEPEEYNRFARFKNNAGALAINKACQNTHHDTVYLLGFDTVLAEGDFLGNIYLDTENYPTKVAFEDQIRRKSYIDWTCAKYPNTKFVFCFPDEVKKFQHMNAPNIVGLNFTKLKERFDA